MAYQKIYSIIAKSAPKETKPFFSEEQLEKVKSVSTIILGIIAVSGMLTLSAVAPNAFIAIDKLFLKSGRRKLSREEKRKKITRAVYYLKSHGYVMMSPTAKDFRLFLTKIGKKKVKDLSFETLTIARPKAWDHRWWQVAADIPTKKHKRSADLFREKLKAMIFFPLQRTLWFYPYDPRPEIELVSGKYGIGNFVTVMEVSRLDYDDEEKMEYFFKRKGIL